MKKLLILLISINISTASFAQKQIQFYGGTMGVYDHPVQTQNGKYVGYYKNISFIDQGRIVLNTSKKTFSIKWLNGTDWNGSYSKVEILKNQYDPLWGNTTNKIFTGRWSNGDYFVFYIKKTERGRCLYFLKTDKILDDYYKLDTWKMLIDFSTPQECINDF